MHRQEKGPRHGTNGKAFITPGGHNQESDTEIIERLDEGTGTQKLSPEEDDPSAVLDKPAAGAHRENTVSETRRFGHSRVEVV